MRLADIDETKVDKHLFKECEALDASCFSGDCLWDEVNRQYLTAMIGRWTRSIANHERLAKEVEAEEDDLEQAKRLGLTC